MAQPQLLGQQLGNYRLTRLLGTGGFAEVYLGEHVHLGTEAAIKVLHTRLEQEDAETFGNEARTIARLKHPHIVRVLDFGIDGTLPYLVMDYAPQGSLRSRHARGTQLPLDLVLSYVKQLADALHYAHERKLIHRDLKPENILVDESDALVLSDFGIATIAQSSRSQNTQDIVGTAAYMAPEQLQGKPRPASDQYSFGIMVYEWLSGTRPFQGTFTEIASQHLLTPPPPLRERRSALPLAIEQVVLTALQKDPHQRFGNVKAFAVAFEQACEQGLRGANEDAIETQRASRPPAASNPALRPIADNPMPPPAVSNFAPHPVASDPVPSPVGSPVPPTLPVPPARPLNTPPIAYPVSRPQPALSSPLMTPPSAAPSLTPRPGTLDGQGSGQRKRNGFKGIYRVIAVLLVVVLIIAGGAIYLNQQYGLANNGNTSNNSNTAANQTSTPFQQAVTVGVNITSIQLGTLYNSNSGKLQNIGKIFHIGDTVYLVCNILPADMQSGVPYIMDQLYLSTEGISTNPGSFDNFHDTYSNWVVASYSGKYTWIVKYQGKQEASITFQVV